MQTFRPTTVENREDLLTELLTAAFEAEGIESAADIQALSDLAYVRLMENIQSARITATLYPLRHRA